MIPGIALLILVAGLVHTEWVRRKEAFGWAVVAFMVAVVIDVLGPINLDPDWIQTLAVLKSLALLALIITVILAYWPGGRLFAVGVAEETGPKRPAKPKRKKRSRGRRRPSGG
ncbi:MAG: hypothetical protein ACYTEZ_15370 [Planctomycetota bacterium]|jgi:hypothetical protein